MENQEISNNNSSRVNGELEEVQKLLLSLKEAESEAKSTITAIKKSQSYNNREKKTLESLNQKAFNAIEQSNQNLSISKKQLSEISRYYENQFNTLKSKIEARNKIITQENIEFRKQKSALASTLSAATKTNNNFDKELNRLKQEIIQSKELLKTIQSQAREIAKQAGQAANHITHIQKRSEKVTILTNQVDTIHSKAKKTASTIHETKRKCDSELDKVTTNKEKSENLYSEILRIYNLSVDGARSGEFKNRRVEFGKAMEKYEKLLFLATSGLFIGIIILFSYQVKFLEEDMTSAFFYIRFLMFSPIVYLIHFLSTQYNSNKKQYEKYAFKATLALSIREHIELLTSNPAYQDEQYKTKILNFIISGFDKLFSEPYTDEDLKMKVKLASVELNLEKNIMKHLNDMVPKSAQSNKSTEENL